MLKALKRVRAHIHKHKLHNYHTDDSVSIDVYAEVSKRVTDNTNITFYRPTCRRN